MRPAPLAPVTLLLAVCTLSVPAPGQTVWTQSFSNTPGARISFGMSYDRARDRIVIFGGSGPSFSFVLRDTWERNGSDWVHRLSVHKPPARVGHAMVYDEGRNKTVLFGGEDGVGNVLADTWEWDGEDWTKRTPSTSPPPRRDHAIAYDSAGDRVLLFGGSDGSGILSDTWAWDGQDWLDLAPASSPPERSRHAMAGDTARQQIVMYGGVGNLVLYRDTWEWDGNDWIQRLGVGDPGPRFDYAMAYDASRGVVVMYGGNLNSFAGTAEWDGKRWGDRSIPEVVSPPSRTGHGLAYDSHARRIVLHGGARQGVLLSETFEYYTQIPATYRDIGPGCPGSVGTPRIAVDSQSLPWLGDTLVVNITNMPSSSAGAYMVIGLSRQAPVDLGQLGMPGCFSPVALDLAQFVAASGGSAQWSLAVPSSKALLSLNFYNQAVVLDPAAPNHLRAVVSNAAEATIGAR